MPLIIIRNNIALVDAEVLVNTANPEVVVGSGVDSAIYEAAGKDELLKEREKIGHLDYGCVGVTSGGKLKAKYIFHASGPRYIDGNHQEADYLRQCYEKCMELAIEKRCKSIAFPLMGTGSYGYPRKEAFEIATGVFTRYLMKSDILVYLVVFDDKSYGVSASVFPDVKSYVDEHYVGVQLTKEYSISRREKACYSYVSNDEMMDAEPSVPVFAEPSLKKQSSLSSSLSDILDRIKREKSKSFGYYLVDLIESKGMSHSEVYKKANMDKKYFSKIINDKVHPSKLRLLTLAVALELDRNETSDLLSRMDYAFNPGSKVDLVFQCFIEQRRYDIYEIDMALYDLGLPTISIE